MEAFSRPFWNLTQVLRWVAHREPDLLKYYVVESFEDDTVLHEPFTIEQGPPLESLPRVGSEDELKPALESGKLKAWGKKNGTDEPQEIPRVVWPFLRFQEYPPRAVSDTVHWRCLRFDREEVLAQWPVSNPRGVVLADEERCTKWLAGLMQPPSKPAHRKEAYFTEARRMFETLSKKAFFRAWGTAVSQSGNSAWSKAGRKS